MSITARIDAITAIPEPYRAVVLPAPRSVKIELSGDCNHHCSFCVRTLREDQGQMDRALFSRLIQEMRGAGVEEIGLFFIGESFLCKWLPEAIAECKDAGIPYVFLTTNGTAATPERIAACMDAGLDSLKFSLNYYDAQQMADVAQVKPSFFRRMIHNIKSAHGIRERMGYKCRLYASSIQFDGEQGEKMREVIEEIRPFVDEHYFLPLFSMGGAADAWGKKRSAGNPGRAGNMRDPLPCWSVTTGHVTHDGKLAACCFGTGLDGSLIMADLKEVDFMTGWNSPQFQALRAAHLAKDVTGTGCEACIAA